jgi:hypothetical protein
MIYAVSHVQISFELRRIEFCGHGYLRRYLPSDEGARTVGRLLLCPVFKRALRSRDSQGGIGVASAHEPRRSDRAAAAEISGPV